MWVPLRRVMFAVLEYLGMTVLRETAKYACEYVFLEVMRAKDDRDQSGR